MVIQDSEDASMDPEPIMVHEDEVDATLEAILESEVGLARSSGYTKEAKRK